MFFGVGNGGREPAVRVDVLIGECALVEEDPSISEPIERFRRAAEREHEQATDVEANVNLRLEC
eukprot:3335510-Prymnesium_polylepis.1